MALDNLMDHLHVCQEKGGKNSTCILSINSRGQVNGEGVAYWEDTNTTSKMWNRS